jgi:hypothetical protein
MPFYRENAETRFLPRPQFLDHEEEFETSSAQDVGNASAEEGSSEDEEAEASATIKGGRPKGVKVGCKAIYVDEVFEIAHQYVCHPSFLLLLADQFLSLQGSYSGAPWQLSFCCPTDVYQEYYRPVVCAGPHLSGGCSSDFIWLREETRDEAFRTFWTGDFGAAYQVSFPLKSCFKLSLNQESHPRTIIHNHLKDCFARTEDRIKWFIGLEALPFTLNQHYLSDYKEKFLAYYKAAREDDIRNFVTKQVKAYKNTSGTSSNSRALSRLSDEDECPKGIPKVLLGLTEMGITGIQPDDIYKILPADEMAPAISIMADVRAYFQGTNFR